MSLSVSLSEGASKKLANFLKLQSIFIGSHPQQKMNDSSFCASVRSLVAKLNHYFNVYFHTNVFLVIQN